MRKQCLICTMITGILVGFSTLAFAKFGTDGKVLTPVGNSGDMAFSIVLQPDGKIVAAGLSNDSSNYQDFALARYNSNGSLDNGFGTEGKVTTPIVSGHDQIGRLVLQPDGKLVAAGWSYNGSTYDLALVRYNSNGSLDTDFGVGSKVNTPTGNGMSFLCGLVLQPDGKIVISGPNFNGAKGNFCLWRLNNDGSLDTSFGTNGRVITAIGSGNDVAQNLVLQPNGKLVAVGYSANGPNNDFALARYNSNGDLDTGFGTSGKVTTAIGSYADFANGLVLQPDGKLVAVGHYDVDGGNHFNFALARYNPDGNLDNS